MGVNRSLDHETEDGQFIFIYTVIALIISIAVPLLFFRCGADEAKPTAAAPACAEVPACICQCLPTVGPAALEAAP
jgi:hypothetical protein